MSFVPTADVCDTNEQAIVLPQRFLSFGMSTQFYGKIRTLRTFEDNSKVRSILETDGKDQVLVIDGGSSPHRALVGGNLGELAEKNHWQGIIVFGAVRDVAELNALQLGIKALYTHPRASIKKQKGDRDVPLVIEGLCIEPGAFLYSDADGVVVTP